MLMYITTVAYSFLLCFVLGYLYLLERRSYLAYWAIGFGLCALKHSLSMVLVKNPWLDVICLISSFVIFQGCFSFMGKDIPVRWKLMGGFLLVYSLLAVFLQVPLIMISLPIAVLSGLIYICTGFVLRRHWHAGRLNRFIGGIFFLWGLNILVSPVIREIPALNSSVTNLEQLLSLFLGLTILIGFITKIKTELTFLRSSYSKIQKDNTVLQQLSFYDSVTGVLNRTSFENEMVRLDNAIFRPMGIIICDIDGLKKTNDTYGHAAGDLLIKQVAEILKDYFSHGDNVFRIGGDEFAVLLPNTEKEIVGRIAKGILETITKHNERNPGRKVSLSVGSAISSRLSMSDLFKKADQEMYNMKTYGSKSVS